jgi:uncharacterized protein
VRNASVVLNSDDLLLSGDVYMPDECDKTFPAVCLCHGIPAVPYDPNEKGGYPELAARFCKEGFVALAFNFRGAGPSQGNIDMVGWTHDLAAAIEFLNILPEVNKEKIYLLGSSGGAAVSIFVAARDRRVSAVATLACPAEFDFLSTGYTAESMIRSFRAIGIIKDPDFPPSVDTWLEGFRTVSPIKYIDRIAPRPILLVHGDKDETVPVAHAGRLYDKAHEPKEMTIISGAGHRLRHDERAIKVAMDWILKQAKQ